MIRRAPPLLLALLLCAAPAARAVRPIRPPAPPFPGGAVWINSAPLTLERLGGRRVTLVSFVNPYNLNSLRAMDALKRWWDLYALEGLMVIAVLTPDYPFARDPIEAKAAVKRLGVQFPVLLDTRGELWRSYKAEGWPMHFLVGPGGRILHDRLGEGGYEEFEREILLALDRHNGYEPPEDYRIPRDPPRVDCGSATKPIYLGSRVKRKLIQLEPNAPTQSLIRVRDGEVALNGDWLQDAESLRYNGRQRGLTDRLRIVYHAAQAAVVASRLGDEPARIYVKQDNLWLHSGNAAADVKWDDEDRSYLDLSAPRLFVVTKDTKEGRLHELSLYPMRAGIAVHALEFADHCEAGGSRP